MKLRNICFSLSLGLIIWSCSEKKGDDAESGQLSNLEKEHVLEKVAYADSVNAGLLEDTFKGSARREAKGTVRNTEVIINYGSPGMRGRVIWNGLVSYDQVWVSGSHWATAIYFSDDVLVEGTEIPAGMYGFFTVPGRDSWTMIINKTFDMHLADDYEESEDVVRLTVMPEELEYPVQRLTYEVDAKNDTEGIISLSWDKIKVNMPFTIK
jgi:hypothetical protein